MPQLLNDNDLIVRIVRIDARTEAMQATQLELKEKMTEKADTERVARLEARQDKSDDRHSQTDKKLNYVIGGLIALESLLKLVWH